MSHNFIKVIIGCIAVWLMQSCRKDVPKNQLITANGSVQDYLQNKPLPNTTVYLFGGHDYGSFPNQQISYDTTPLDSVITDANGEFTISYRAEGKSDDYALGITKNYMQPNYIENILPFPGKSVYPFNYVYSLQNVFIQAAKLHYLNLTLQVTSNPYDTLLFTIYNPPSGEEIGQYQLFGNSINTVIHTRYLPLSTNVFEYAVQTLSLDDSASSFIRLTADTLNLGNADTLSISKKFNSTYDIPLKPN